MPFTLLDDYPPPPLSDHVCVCCGAGRRTTFGVTERVVDLGITVEVVVDGTGTSRFQYAYVCETCVRELGRLVGMADTERVAQLETELAEVRDESTARMARIVELEQVIAGYRLVSRFAADRAAQVGGELRESVPHDDEGDDDQRAHVAVHDDFVRGHPAGNTPAGRNRSIETPAMKTPPKERAQPRG